jgi:hypothetical protein
LWIDFYGEFFGLVNEVQMLAGFATPPASLKVLGVYPADAFRGR